SAAVVISTGSGAATADLPMFAPLASTARHNPPKACTLMPLSRFGLEMSTTDNCVLPAQVWRNRGRLNCQWDLFIQGEFVSARFWNICEPNRFTAENAC